MSHNFFSALLTSRGAGWDIAQCLEPRAASAATRTSPVDCFSSPTERCAPRPGEGLTEGLHSRA